VDLSGGIADLEQHAAQVLADGRLALTVTPLRPQVIELGAAAEQARQLLAGAITIRLYDPVNDQRLTWQVTPAEIGETLVLQMPSGNPSAASWAVDAARLKELLRRKAETLTGGQTINPQEALPLLTKAIMGPRGEIKLRVYHDGREHLVKPGETLSSIADDYGIPYPWIQQTNPELGDNLRSGQKLLIPSQDEMIPLPPVENKRIIVSMKEQKLQAFENGKVKWEWVISTGIASSPTAPGVFQVQARDPYAYANNWDLWMPWFVGFYRPVPTSDFMNGFHGFPKRGGTQLLWTNSLGKPVTYGCVLTTTENAKLLYDWAEDGVVVEVRR
jgi:lipoprotein-anchoring transpeptidase ErfK/SrfK